MPGRGLPPKDPSKRRRRNVDPIPQTVVVNDGSRHGPDLPDVYEWHPRTVEWWETWRTSPQAAEFTKTDWDFLVDTAMLHSRFWGGATMLAPELRLRAAKFGQTPEDRLRLRLSVTEPDEQKPSGTSPRKSRYEHLRPA